MCYCRPEIRTMFCSNCAPIMYSEITRLTAQLEQANKALEKYKGAVEVEGKISSVIRTADYTEVLGVSITPQCLLNVVGQRVKVLVTKEVVGNE